MNRLIKFRAWDKPNKMMQIIGSLSWLVGGLKAYGQGSYIANHDYFVDGENVVLMQFTGLLDKNGKEIYEGDIVNSKGGTFQVWFRLGCWFAGSVMGNHDDNYYEIIGNIYENPQLLSSN